MIVSLAYAMIFLVGAELLLPIPDPSAIVIFDIESFDFVFPEILKLSPIWLGAPIFIGALTATGFGFILVIYHPSRGKYILICTTLCILAVLPIYIIPAIEIIFNVPFNVLLEAINNPLWQNSHQMTALLLTIALESVLIVMLQAFLAFVANWQYTPYFRWIKWCARSREPDGDNDLAIRRFVQRPSGEGALENL